MTADSSGTVDVARNAALTRICRLVFNDSATLRVRCVMTAHHRSTNEHISREMFAVCVSLLTL